MTLHDAEVDQIMDKIEAIRANSNVLYCEGYRMMLKCPHCVQRWKELQAKIRANDQKILELNELLCA